MCEDPNETEKYGEQNQLKRIDANDVERCEQNMQIFRTRTRRYRIHLSHHHVREFGVQQSDDDASRQSAVEAKQQSMRALMGTPDGNGCVHSITHTELVSMEHIIAVDSVRKMHKCFSHIEL